MPENKTIITSSLWFSFLFSVLLILADITGYLSFYKNIRSFVINPISNGTSIVSIGVRNMATSIFSGKTLKRENLSLKQRILELEDTLQLYKDTRDLAPELQATISAARQSSYGKTITAQIITTRYGNSEGKLLLNKGTGDDVALGQPVVFGSRYVGYISEAFTTYSVCTTIKVPGQEFVGYITKRKVTGVLHSDINSVFLTDLLSTDPVTVQDPVQVKLDTFPYFYTLGVVEEIPQREGSAEKTAIIGSIVKPEELSFVTIVLK